MKKTCLIVILLLAMATLAFAETPATPIRKSGDYTYILLTGNTAQIVSWDGADKHLTVPSKLDEFTVVSVSECAFADCAALESVTLPQTVVEIGECAFVDCDNLQKVVLPEGLVRIGNLAFDSCEGLTVIELPNSVREMGDNPFRGCANLYDIRVSEDHPYLSTVDGALYTRPDHRLVCYPNGLYADYYRVPEGVETIGAMAFDRDLYIEQIVLPASLVTIGDGAFNGCEALKTMNLPSGVQSIGEAAMRCSNLKLTIEGDTSVTFLADAVEIMRDEA